MLISQRIGALVFPEDLATHPLFPANSRQFFCMGDFLIAGLASQDGVKSTSLCQEWRLTLIKPRAFANIFVEADNTESM